MIQFHAKNLVVGALVCASLVLPLNAFAQETSELTPQQQFENAMAEGDKHAEEGNLEDAISSYSKAIPVAGFSAPLAQARRAAVFAKLEDYEAALKDYKDALDLSPNFVDALNGRGEIFLELGANDQALADLQIAYESDRDNPRIIVNLGKAYALLGGSDQAIRLLDRYIKMAEQENPEAYRLRAQAYASQRKFDQARQDIEHAIALDPENHESHFVLGVIEAQDENYPEASQALGESITKYKPKKGQEDLPHVQAHLLKASVHEEHGKKTESPEEQKAAHEAQIAECDRLLKSLPDTPTGQSIRAAALFRRGVGERLLGRYGEAVRSFSEAIDINPGLADAYFRRGICFHEMGEEMLAIRDFEHAAAIEFDTPRAYFWQGLSWAKLGQYRNAIKAYGEAISQSERYVPAYVNRGLAYMQLGDFQKAINDFNEAIRLQSTVADHYYKRGMAYALNGEHAEAVRSLINAIELDDTLVPAYQALADELGKLGHSDLEQEYRRKAEELEKAANGG